MEPWVIEFPSTAINVMLHAVSNKILYQQQLWPIGTPVHNFSLFNSIFLRFVFDFLIYIHICMYET